jgi:hypothetical protein
MEVFVSYSRSDAGFVDRLAQELDLIGVEARFDRVLLSPGDKWADVLSGALERAEIVIFVMSNASFVSEGVQTEISNAMKHAKRIMPLLIEDSPIPSYLSDYHYVDFPAVLRRGLRCPRRGARCRDKRRRHENRRGAGRSRAPDAETRARHAAIANCVFEQRAHTDMRCRSVGGFGVAGLVGASDRSPRPDV